MTSTADMGALLTRALRAGNRQSGSVADIAEADIPLGAVLAQVEPDSGRTSSDFLSAFTAAALAGSFGPCKAPTRIHFDRLFPW